MGPNSNSPGVHPVLARNVVLKVGGYLIKKDPVMVMLLEPASASSPRNCPPELLDGVCTNRTQKILF